MDSRQILRITKRPSLSTRTCLSTFVSVFAVLWLLVEPLPSLGLLPALLPIPRWSLYLSLLIAASVITAAVEYLSHVRLLGITSFTRVTVLITESGTRHEIDAPRDMNVQEFVTILCRTLAKRAPSDTALSHENLYDKTLLVQRSSQFKEVDPKLTVREAGIQDGDVLKIRGRIRPVHSMVCFNSAVSTAESRAIFVRELREAEETYNHYATLAARLNETSEGEADLREYLLAEAHRPQWEAAGLPHPHSARENQSKWREQHLPDPWKNPRTF